MRKQSVRTTPTTTKRRPQALKEETKKIKCSVAVQILLYLSFCLFIYFFANRMDIRLEHV